MNFYFLGIYHIEISVWCCMVSNKHINEGANRIYTCRATIWTLQTVFMDFNSHFKISITIILRKNVQIGTWRNQNLWWKIHKNSLKRSNVLCTRKPKPCQIVPCAKSYNNVLERFFFFYFFPSIDWRFNWRPIFIWDVPYFAPFFSFIGYNLFNGFIDRGCVSPKHRRNFITDTQTNHTTPP